MLICPTCNGRKTETIMDLGWFEKIVCRKCGGAGFIEPWRWTKLRVIATVLVIMGIVEICAVCLALVK